MPPVEPTGEGPPSLGPLIPLEDADTLSFRLTRRAIWRVLAVSVFFVAIGLWAMVFFLAAMFARVGNTDCNGGSLGQGLFRIFAVMVSLPWVALGAAFLVEMVRAACHPRGFGRSLPVFDRRDGWFRRGGREVCPLGAIVCVWVVLEDEEENPHLREILLGLEGRATYLVRLSVIWTEAEAEALAEVLARFLRVPIARSKGAPHQSWLGRLLMPRVVPRGGEQGAPPSGMWPSLPTSSKARSDS